MRDVKAARARLQTTAVMTEPERAPANIQNALACDALNEHQFGRRR